MDGRRRPSSGAGTDSDHAAPDDLGRLDRRVVHEAGRQLRAPAAAGIAGLLFAVLFTAGLVLLRHEAIYTADDAELVRAVRPR